MKIREANGFVFERTLYGEKIHLRRNGEPEFLCNARYGEARTVKGPIDMDVLCSNCYDCGRGYVVVTRKPAEVSDNDSCGEVVTDNSETLKNALAKLHEYECRAKAAEDEVAELKHKLSKKERQLIQSQKSDERQHRKTVEATTLCNSYRSATNGHTLEDIKTIMQAMPSPEELDGCKLVVTCDMLNPYIVHLDVVPIVEYFQGPITDELVQEHGRIECEVKDFRMEEWRPSELLLVDPKSEAPFGAFSEKDGVETWEECRILQSTIDKARAKRG
jgi:hypothetical protein